MPERTRRGERRGRRCRVALRSCRAVSRMTAPDARIILVPNDKTPGKVSFLPNQPGTGTDFVHWAVE